MSATTLDIVAEMKSAYAEYKIVEKRGLAFGKKMYELRAASEVVQGGTSFTASLIEADIPRRTAYYWIESYEIEQGLREDAPETIDDTLEGISIPSEINDAVEYIPPASTAKPAEPTDSKTTSLRNLFTGVTGVVLVRLAASTFNSGIPSSTGRWDIALNGLTANQIKAVRDLL